MKNFKKLIKEALKPDYLKENREDGYLLDDLGALESHPDIEILINTIRDKVGIDVDTRIRGYKGPDGEGVYLRTPSLRIWDDEVIDVLKRAFDAANERTEELNFEFSTTSDWEEDPGERTWDADFAFFIDEKERKSKFKKAGEMSGFDMRGINEGFRDPEDNYGFGDVEYGIDDYEIGDKVVVSNSLTTDPLNKQGETGVVKEIDIEEGTVFVMFDDGLVGGYTSGAVVFPGDEGKVEYDDDFTDEDYDKWDVENLEEDTQYAPRVDGVYIKKTNMDPIPRFKILDADLLVALSEMGRWIEVNIEDPKVLPEYLGLDVNVRKLLRSIAYGDVNEQEDHDCETAHPDQSHGEWEKESVNEGYDLSNNEIAVLERLIMMIKKGDNLSTNQNIQKVAIPLLRKIMSGYERTDSVSSKFSEPLGEDLINEGEDYFDHYKDDLIFTVANLDVARDINQDTERYGFISDHYFDNDLRYGNTTGKDIVVFPSSVNGQPTTNNDIIKLVGDRGELVKIEGWEDIVTESVNDEVDEGTCGYGKDGKIGKKPAGPDLLDEGFVEGELEKRNEALYDVLVPSSGKTGTVEGEMLRAINRIVYRWWNDGDKFYEGYGAETAGPAHSFLVNSSNPLRGTLNSIFDKAITSSNQGDAVYERIVELALTKVLDYIESKEGNYSKSGEDMFDYESEYEDQDDSWDDDYNDDEYEDEYYQQESVNEGMSPEEWEAAKEAERLENHPESKKIRDIQKMFDNEKKLKKFGSSEIDEKTILMFIDYLGPLIFDMEELDKLDSARQMISINNLDISPEKLLDATERYAFMEDENLMEEDEELTSLTPNEIGDEERSDSFNENKINMKENRELSQDEIDAIYNNFMDTHKYKETVIDDPDGTKENATLKIDTPDGKSYEVLTSAIGDEKWWKWDDDHYKSRKEEVYESKKFNFKGMIKEALTPDYLK